MKVCVQCGKENIPVTPPNDKCPHEYEIEIEAADALAQAARQLASNLFGGCGCGQLCDHHSHWNSETLSALAAYKKARGLK